MVAKRAATARICVQCMAIVLYSTLLVRKYKEMGGFGDSLYCSTTVMTNFSGKPRILTCPLRRAGLGRTCQAYGAARESSPWIFYEVAIPSRCFSLPRYWLRDLWLLTVCVKVIFATSFSRLLPSPTMTIIALPKEASTRGGVGMEHKAEGLFGSFSLDANFSAPVWAAPTALCLV